MRILFIGDVVGNAGLNAAVRFLRFAIAEWEIDLTVVNGENAAGKGFGISEVIYNELLAAGADAVTLGNHTWDCREALDFIAHAPRLIRPINFMRGAPGRGAAVVETRRGRRALVLNAMGRMFMQQSVEDPFGAIDREISVHSLGRSVDAIVVDFHGESAGEKQAMGHFCDGRVSLVVGTHTHTPTADHRILQGRTAYMTDVGMTGDYDSVVGMQKDEPLRRFTTGIPRGRFEAATGSATVCALAVETDDRTGLAIKLSPVRLGGRLEDASPVIWIPE